MLCLMNRCSGSFTDVVAHLQMKWLNGDVVVAHLDFFSSFGDVVAHLKMKCLNGDVVLAHLDILLLIRGSSGSFKNEVAQFEMQWLIEGCTVYTVYCTL